MAGRSRIPILIWFFLKSPAFGFSLLLAGCDYVDGVQENAKISQMPRLSCVTSVVRQVPGVEKVEVHIEPAEGSEVTLTGLHPEGPVYSIIYTGKTPQQMGGVVQLQPNWRGYIDYSQTDLWIDKKPAQAQIDATRPVMHEIAQKLYIKCGIAELKTPLTEICTGVSCPPLPGP